MNDIKECFICYTNSGKTDNHELYELMMGIKKFNYPFVSLSDAYGCKCKTTYAHNVCLMNIKKSPTCRKVVSKPKLYVKSKIDFYLPNILKNIKKNPKIIDSIILF
jgi:hypothetical protein